MSTLACPVPFLDARDFPPNVGYVAGRLCSPLPLPGAKEGAVCCLPCPVQDWVFHPSTLHVLFANDIVNMVGLGVGAFVLLSFMFLPEKVTYRSSLGISISLAAFLINFCFIFPLHDLNSVQCANAITPANQKSNPICGFQGSMHVFAGHSVALLVVCRTIYLHCQICWNLHVSRIPLIFLNIIGWLIPAVFLIAAIAVAGITYTITDHCSIRQDWIINLLILPIIIEIGISIIVQFATFVYCANVYLRSVREPPPPSGESFATSELSSGRYPYRKAMARINKAFKLQWRAWTQCFALIWTGSFFSVAYYFLATKYVGLQNDLAAGQAPDPNVIIWALCLIETQGRQGACDDKVTFVPSQSLLLIAEFCISTSWVWVSLVFLRLNYFPEWIKLFKRTGRRIKRIFQKDENRTSGQSGFITYLHSPSKESFQLKTKPLEAPYQLKPLDLPRITLDLHPPPSPSHSRSDSKLPILLDAARPGSSRPGSQRSHSRKNSSRKIHIEEILAMRRMEAGEPGSPQEYPGIQPLRLTSDSQEPLPPYQFRYERGKWDDV